MVGPLGRLDARHEIVLSNDAARIVLLAGLGAHAGYMGGGPEDGSGARVGAELPLVPGIDVAGLVSLYLGGRVAIEHAWRRARAELGASGRGAHGLSRRRALRARARVPARPRPPRAQRGLRSGGRVRSAERIVEVDGLVLVPAFGLRVRL